MPYCTRCGKQNRDMGRYCVDCGAEFDGDDPADLARISKFVQSSRANDTDGHNADFQEYVARLPLDRIDRLSFRLFQLAISLSGQAVMRRAIPTAPPEATPASTGVKD